VQQNPGFMVLQWRGRADAYLYQPQQFTGAEWVDLAPVLETGRGYYTYTTSWLDANSNGVGSVSQFRVKIVDSVGNFGGYVYFDFYVIRHPDPPEVVVTWNELTNEIEVNSV
jgi:hypothetical protein